MGIGFVQFIDKRNPRGTRSTNFQSTDISEFTDAENTPFQNTFLQKKHPQTDGTMCVWQGFCCNEKSHPLSTARSARASIVVWTSRGTKPMLNIYLQGRRSGEQSWCSCFYGCRRYDYDGSFRWQYTPSGYACTRYQQTYTTTIVRHKGADTPMPTEIFQYLDYLVNTRGTTFVLNGTLVTRIGNGTENVAFLHARARMRQNWNGSRGCLPHATVFSYRITNDMHRRSARLRMDL